MLERVYSKENPSTLLVGEKVDEICAAPLENTLELPLKQGVPIVAQWLTNPTRNHEVVGSVPALAQRVNDPALP